VGDAEGRLPSDNRAFFHKVLPPIGWMVLRVLDALVRRRELGLPGPLRHVELAETMPPGLRRRLLQPLAPNWREVPVPTPGREEFDALRRDIAPANASLAAVGG
jgi:hypothetical protein